MSFHLLISRLPMQNVRGLYLSRKGGNNKYNFIIIIFGKVCIFTYLLKPYVRRNFKNIHSSTDENLSCLPHFCKMLKNRVY